MKFKKNGIPTIGSLKMSTERKSLETLNAVKVIIGLSLMVFSITGFFFLIFVWRYVQIRYSFPFAGSAIVAIALLWNEVNQGLKDRKVIKGVFIFTISFALVISALTSLNRGYTLALSRNMDRELAAEVSARVSSGNFSRLYVNFPSGSELISGLNALQASISTDSKLTYESIDFSSNPPSSTPDTTENSLCTSLVAVNLRDTGMEGVGWAGRFFTMQWDYNSQLQWLEKQDKLHLLYNKTTARRLFLPFDMATAQINSYPEIVRSIKPNFALVAYGWKIYEFVEVCRDTNID